jgi:hypothetical protein
MKKRREESREMGEMERCRERLKKMRRETLERSD